ncbi:Sec-independent protein translocase protein TatA [Paraconexibacter sp. AEG42_29]|uniref:Sec-independent protein translocase protein TatA n=1 Tax=Paraconexibacter sp. AEG42_29 TaxID=2997339 RepID=A0AAU7B3F5_9ACTN
MPNIGPLELVILLVILLVIFGPKRLPGLGKQLGGGLKDFKEAVTAKHDRDDEDDDPPALPPGERTAPAPSSTSTTSSSSVGKSSGLDG